MTRVLAGGFARHRSLGGQLLRGGREEQFDLLVSVLERVLEV